MNIEDIQATLGEIERKAAAGAALREDLGKIGDRLAALEMRNTDLEQMLASGNRRGGSAERGTPEQREHLEVFKKWLRNPKSSRIRGELEVAETKAASGLTDTAGGALVPELILGELNRRVKDGSPMRQLANVMDVASGDMKYPIGNNDATSGWVGETDTRAATGEPTIESRTPTGGTVYAYIKATEELLQDSRFPIDEWFVNAVTDEIISTEGAAFISGNGTKKPTGLLNAVPDRR
ncbi:phage major capsid protein [Pseudooceanicola sp. 502str34]